MYYFWKKSVMPHLNQKAGFFVSVSVCELSEWASIKVNLIIFCKCNKLCTMIAKSSR